MLRIQMILLALVAVFAMSAVAAAGASAHEWLINKAAIPTAKTVMSKATLLLTDHNPTGGQVSVSCTGFDTGTVGPGALDIVEKVSSTVLGATNDITCSFEEKGACESSPAPTALAVDLPWHTELYLAGTQERDMITPDGNGNPGWAVTCKTLLGSMTDTCTTALGSTLVTNVTGGGVEAEFEKESQPANCKLGGGSLREKAGLVKGVDLLENPGSGESLSFD